MQLNKRLATFSFITSVLTRPGWVILDGEACTWQILSARTIFWICDPHGKTGVMNFHHKREKKNTARRVRYKFHDVNLNFYAFFTQVQVL